MPKLVTETAGPKVVIPPQNGDLWGMIGDIRILLYGESGTGKTRFWSTFPGPIDVAICSGGRKPGELKSIDTPEMRIKVRPTLVSSTAQFEMWLSRDTDARTRVLDHATGFSDLIITELLGLSEIPVSKYRIAGKGESWSIVSKQQYGQQAIRCKEYFRAFLNLPGNIVIVSQERLFRGAEEGMESDVIKPTVGAAMTPSVTGWLNPACDYVVQTFKRGKTQEKPMNIGGKTVNMIQRVDGVDYCLRCVLHDTYITKFRVPPGTVLQDIVDPTYDKVQLMIKGG